MITNNLPVPEKVWFV